MNNRQKAKHWKRLYEESLSKKPYPVVYKTLLPKHYRVQYSIDAKELAYIQLPEAMKNHIENRLLQYIRPLIWDSIRTEKDIYTDKYIYSLDIWMEEQGEQRWQD